MLSAETHRGNREATGQESYGRFLYNRFRYYDPGIGRYVSADPIRQAGGANVYGYSRNSPITWADPLGLSGCYLYFDGYPIKVPHTNISLPLGHAGVVSYDPETGATRYYEYGRYGSPDGTVERRWVPDLELDEDGNITPESWKKLMDYISEHYGKGKPISEECSEEADEDAINDFAERYKNDPNRPPYSWNPLHPNQCKTFARDALEAGINAANRDEANR